MRQQLEPIINKLISDPFFAVRITNADNFKVICTNKTGALMQQEAGSVDGFFNKIVVEDGNVNLMIQPRRKNGSTYKDSGDPVLIKTIPDHHYVEPQGKIDFPPTLNQNNHPAPQGLSYPAVPMPHNSMGHLMAGLNGMDVAYRYQDYPKIVLENEKLRLENEAQRKEILKLEREALQNEFSENKAANSSAMLGGIIDQLPMLLQGFAALKGGGAAAPGLGSPAQIQEDLSPIKSQLMQYVRTESDNMLFFILKTLEGCHTNQAFGIELQDLLAKHKLIPLQNG